MEVAEALKEMEQTIDSFEKHKLEDTKSILTDFILINLKYHSQALELYTSAFQDISDIDEKKDLQVGLQYSHYYYNPLILFLAGPQRLLRRTLKRLIG